MRILLLGSGGREHALAWKIAQSPLVDALYIAPGNAGTAFCGTNIPLLPTNFVEIKDFVIRKNISMVVVGPEDPLVLGIVDEFKRDVRTIKIPVIGPSSAGAQLEGSKAFAKDFMLRYDIPTARYCTFSAEEIAQAEAFLRTIKPPYVLKADGLCAGKGVLILPTLEQAIASLHEMLHGMFGKASAKVVIEEYLSGTECSVFVLTDGKNYKILPQAKDYKRIGEGDKGPNTGGMGSVSPVPFATQEWMEKVEKRIIRPTIDGLCKENIEYRGFIFFGLINVNNDPYVIEYNCRMGDPETQSVLLRLKSDIVPLLEGVAYGNLDTKTMDIDSRSAACVVLASEGYPGDYSKGYEITGLDKDYDGVVFFAGASKLDEHIVTSGGRVLACCALGKDRKEALSAAYNIVNGIDFKGRYFRKDIGLDLDKV